MMTLSKSFSTMRTRIGRNAMPHLFGVVALCVIPVAQLAAADEQVQTRGALEEVPLGEKAIRVRRSDGRTTLTTASSTASSAISPSSTTPDQAPSSSTSTSAPASGVAPSREAPASGASNHSTGLDVAFRTAENRYLVGETIRFEVKGNQPFFLYLFNIDPDTSRAVSILPNQRQGKDKLRYPGDNRWRAVPNPSIEFYSDRAGTERIVMVASERYLNVERLVNGYGTKAIGASFYESENVLDWLDSELSMAYALGGKDLDESKAIRVRKAGGRSLPSGVVVEEMNLRISE